jgi:hypothetical protein
MSLEKLQQLVGARGFDQRPPSASLYALHVPFDELVPGSQVERQLRELAHRSERIGLVGPSGAGKSSVVSYTFGPSSEGLAPIYVPVRAEEDVVTEPKALAGHIVRMLARALSLAQQITESERLSILRDSTPAESLPGSSRGLSGTIGMQWLARAELTGAMQSIVSPDHSRRSLPEIVDVVGAAMRILSVGDLIPVLIIDDSDAWLASLSHSERQVEVTVSRFFGSTLSFVCDLPCALVVAIHDHYLESSSFPRGTGILDRFLDVPSLPDRSALDRLIAGRARLCGVECVTSDVITDEALATLEVFYRAEAHLSIRKVMAVLNTALNHAEGVLNECIGLADIETALAETP